MELIPVHSVADPVRFVALLRQADWSVLATGRPSPDTDVPCLPVAHQRLEKPTLLLLGKKKESLKNGESCVETSGKVAREPGPLYPNFVSCNSAKLIRRR